MFFDEVVLQQQSVHFAFHHDVFNVHNVAHQQASAVVVVGFGKIGVDPFFEVFGFPYINDVSFGIVILINPRAIGEGFQLNGKIGVFHATKLLSQK